MGAAWYQKHRDELRAWLAAERGLIPEPARDELADVTRLTEAIAALGERIQTRVHAVAPALLAVPRCGELMAAKIVGETAAVTLFKSEAAFACHAGVAPVSSWSGDTAGRMHMTGM